MQFLLVWESRNLQHKMKKKTFIRVIIYKFIKWINKNPRFHVTLCFTWTVSGNELQQFMIKINEVHPSIRYDFNY